MSPGETLESLNDAAVDRSAEIPVGTQLVWALRARIGDGRLAPGERLPGVRDLAGRFQINANTARTVYQRLERAGLIESRQGMGTFVVGATQGNSGVGELTADTARRAREVGVDPRELATALYVASESHPPRGSQPSPARPAGEDSSERRQQLREQIAALEQALGEIEARNPGLLSPPAPAPRLAGPRLLSAAELEQVRGGLMRRLSEAQLALDARLQTADAETATKTKRTATVPRAARSPSGSTAKKPKPTPAARPSTRPSTA